MLLVPALVKLMGDVNWWAPKFMAKPPIDFDPPVAEDDIAEEAALV